ncbi:MAG: PEP-CTERM sorting domain-containing protein [Planctomycetales bacterium]|nr:PEP-CTERM sorting domain-containing protein [Planctomycetales bacterium]
MRSLFRRSALLTALVVLTAPNWATAADIVPFGQSWTYLSPLSDAEDPAFDNPNFDSTWYLPSFNTNGWAGPSQEPFAWPAPDVGVNIDAFTPDNASFIREANTFLEIPESGQRYSVYYRTDFTTAAAANQLALEILADDGAAIYLDGQQVAMFNCCQATGPGDDPFFLELASATGNETSYTVLPILAGQSLSAGSHTLAVQVVSAAVDSSDMGFSMRLVSDYVSESLIQSGSEWRYMLGEEEPSNGTLDWTESDFADAGWFRDIEGFGFEESGADGVYTNDLVQTYLEEMIGTDITTLYLRRGFNVADPTKFDSLDLYVDYDDAFVAYINGQQVASSFADPDSDPTTGIPFDTRADDLGDANHESTNGSGARGELFTIDLSQYTDLLNQGSGNVLAIQGINRNPSSDFAIAQIELLGTGGLTVAPVGVPGDYNNDGLLTAEDIDALSLAVRNGDSSAKYDLNKDGQVDESDRTTWIEGLRKTYIGDSNMDGEFSTSDFVQVFQRGEYEDGIAGNSTWEDGDWTGDGDFDTRDFVAAFQSGGFEAGPRAAVAAVPEPASSLLLVIGTMLLGIKRRAVSF